MAVRRAAVFDVGGFDERLGPGAGVHGEEGDLVVRLASRGWECVIAAAPAVSHASWRSEAERRANLFVYQRGAGAWLGAGMRRDPRRVTKLLLLRLLHQAHLWRNHREHGWLFGPQTTAAFLAGLARGLTFAPRRWLDPW
jgi:GT2 family glycosyltransferase